MSADFCLVTMPYARIELSSVALGLLQSVLREAGYSARSVYGNILFGERTGSLSYSLISLFRPRLAIADWTFAHAAFPEYEPDHARYLDLVLNMQGTYAPWDRDRFESLLWDVRQKADDFIEDLAHDILGLHPRIVGCSSTFCQHVPSLALLRAVKQKAPEVVTVLGGTNCETVMGVATHRMFGWVDYVVSGEADNVIAPLTKGILEKARDIGINELPEGVFGPVHRSEGYPMAHVGDRSPIPRAVADSLEDQPVPDYADFIGTIKATQRLKNLIYPGLTVESARGCWWGEKKGCTFCGFNGRAMKFRSKSPGKFLQELRILRSRHGLDGIETVDNILNMSYLNSVFPALKSEGSPYRLFYEIKSNLQRRHVRTLREAGVIWVQTGIESLNSSILKLMNKGCKAWQNIQLLKWLREFGIRVHWNLLFDFPGDQDDWYGEIAELIPLLTHLQPAVKMVPLEFSRFSVYHDEQQRFGLKLRPAAPYSYVYPLSSDELGDLVYFFEDEQRAAIEQSSVLAFFLERPVFHALREQYEGWRRDFWTRNATLSMKLSNTEIIVTDTREVAANPQYRLAGLKRDVYLAGDRAPKMQSLLEQFSSNGASRSEVVSVCDELIRNRLSLEIDGRLVSLAVREPFLPLPTPLEYPGGVCLPG